MAKNGIEHKFGNSNFDVNALPDLFVRGSDGNDDIFPSALFSALQLFWNNQLTEAVDTVNNFIQSDPKYAENLWLAAALTEVWQ